MGHSRSRTDPAWHDSSRWASCPRGVMGIFSSNTLGTDHVVLPPRYCSFQKPIWVTEVSCASAGSDAGQAAAFMR